MAGPRERPYPLYPLTALRTHLTAAGDQTGNRGDVPSAEPQVRRRAFPAAFGRHRTRCRGHPAPSLPRVALTAAGAVAVPRSVPTGTLPKGRGKGAPR